MKCAQLNSGVRIPLVGLGTYRLKGYEIVRATLDSALKCGYRLIDSAGGYGNESDIYKALLGEGDLLRKHNLTRDDVFITSKLGPRDMQNADEAIARSVANLGGRIDLYLIHWPGNGGWQPNDLRHQQVRREAWLRLESAKQRGILRDIGISNYTRKHVDELLSYCSVKPALLQSERHPLLTQNELISHCERAGIHFQAYSSLGAAPPGANNPLFASETVQLVAKKHGVSVAQVLLRYSVQGGVSVVPKSTSEAHLAENIDIFGFELDSDDVRRLDGLNQDLHICWNPDTIS